MAFFLQEEQGLLMPQWAQNVDLEELKSFAEIESMQLFKTPTMMKLQTGMTTSFSISPSKINDNLGQTEMRYSISATSFVFTDYLLKNSNYF